MSHYVDDVRILKEAVGPDRLGVWFYDQLVADYMGTVRSVLRFLGLPEHPDEAAGVPRVNVSGTPRLLPLQRMIWAATRNERLRAAVKRGTSFRFREQVRRRSLRPSTVPSEARSELTERFTDDLHALAALVDGAVPQWLTVHRPPQSARDSGLA
jgi:hypothetical protein